MNIDKETLKKVAHLARLGVDPSMEKEMLQDMEEILTWVEKLKEVDTEGVAPLTQMSFEKNAMRPDKAKRELSKDAGLKNAPGHDGHHFLVPKVLDQKK
ncbi:MAG: Asp-tRNA(Asn)/Glu-tRNA(Gln) amidotransferase subunit GatC [Cytophagales bacterium]|nr:Asp-tRNA(Asn)/Glu-tRNA(Gln) amidotransferase subunit GatC [Cytophagales bacterium]